MCLVVMTIPGVRCLEAGMILGETKTVHRFSAPCKLLAFAGIDSSIHQSGNFNALIREYLKENLYTYVVCPDGCHTHHVVRNNAVFKQMYDKKRDAGLTHDGTLGNCAGKRVCVIYKVLTDNVTFSL
jgi:transposase